MADFINTIDVLGDDAVIDSIINRTITEFKDDQIMTVGRSAFSNCASLETVSLPNVATLGRNTFDGCSAMTAADFPLVTVLTGGNFNGCTSLASVNFPNVTRLEGTPIFSGCSSLTSLELPNATTLNADCLCRTPSVRRLVLPKVTSINSYSLREAGFKIIDCWKAVKFTGYPIHGSSLTALILRDETLSTNASPGLDSWGNYPVAYIYVPAALVDSYKAATNWSNAASKFRALEDYTVDGTTTGELDETKI